MTTNTTNTNARGNYAAVCVATWRKMLRHYGQQPTAYTFLSHHDGGDHGLAYLVWGDASLQILDPATRDKDLVDHQERMAHLCHLHFENRLLTGGYQSYDWMADHQLYLELMEWLADPENLRLADSMRLLYWSEKQKPTLRP